jgi:alcohol dehydrogenase class IV
MGVASEQDGNEAACERLVDCLIALNDDLDVPTPRSYGLDAERWSTLLPLMAKQALASGSPANNPVEPSADEIVALYREAWAG